MPAKPSAPRFASLASLLLSSAAHVAAPPTPLQKWVHEKRSLQCELCSTAYREPFAAMLATAIPPAPRMQQMHGNMCVRQ